MKKLYLILFCFAFFTLSSCEDFLDCVIDRRPQIHDKTFASGTVGVYYYQEVTTEIKNEPRDNDYGYFYEVYGNLPDGIQMFPNYRTVSFEGTPEVSGTFKFTLLLYVDPPGRFDDDGIEFEQVMCSESTSKDFTITINEL